MSGITDLLLSQLGGGQLGQLAQAVGASEGVTQKAVQAAIPALLGGLARNATASPEGASALASALDRDHDGSILDDVGGLLGAFGGGSGSSSSPLGGLLGAAAGMMGGGSQNAQAGKGAGIMKHVFGGKQAGIEGAVGQASGLDLGQAASLMTMLAPMVMGALGKAKKEQGLDADALAGLLGQEKESLVSKAPALGGIMGMLDADGDGSVTDELTSLGGGLLKNFLSKR
jgi:hypothetical protein